MAANETYLIPASEGELTITSSDTFAIERRINQLLQEADTLTQFLRDHQPQETSSPGQQPHNSTLVGQPATHFIHTEDRIECLYTPTTAFFPSFPMSPLPVDGDAESDPNIAGPQHSRFTPTAHPRSASEAADGSSSFPLSQRRAPAISTISHRARASTSTPFTSPRESRHWESEAALFQYQSIIELKNCHWFIRTYGFNRVRAATLSPGEPYTRATIPWPTDIGEFEFLQILERALRPHAESCDVLHSSPATCQSCIARIEALGILTRVLTNSQYAGQSLFHLRDIWYPNDDWLTIAVDQTDQHFVRMGMLLVHEAISNMVEQIGVPDPMEWRMSLAQAMVIRSQLYRRI